MTLYHPDQSVGVVRRREGQVKRDEMAEAPTSEAEQKPSPDPMTYPQDRSSQSFRVSQSHFGHRISTPSDSSKFWRTPDDQSPIHLRSRLVGVRHILLDL